MIDRYQISFFQIQDIILLPFWVFIFYTLYKKWVIKDEVNFPTVVKLFKIAFFFRLFCTIFHALIAIYYYDKVSDSLGYFTDVLNIQTQFANNPKANLFDFYFDRDAFEYNTGMEFNSLGATVTANVSLLTTPLSYIFFNSYICLSFFLSFVALLACHKLYIVFSNVFPSCKIESAIAAMLLPGLTFWSAILLKDTYSLIGLGFSMWFFWKLFIVRKISIINILGFLVSLSLMYSFKPYILVISISYILWFGLSVYKKIKSSFLKFFSLIAFFSVLILVLSLALKELSNLETGPLATYKLENIGEQLASNTYQSETIGGGSNFSLGNIDFNSPASIAAAAPRALSSVYFQPFIWEATKPIMLLSALESLLIFYLFLYAMFKTKIFGFFGIIFKNPFLLSFFIFCLFFGTIVPIAAPNFGTLARYKIPCMPFMVFIY